MCRKSKPAPARMARASSHSGHGVSRTKWPLWKRLSGYLKRSSNIKFTSRVQRDECVDAVVAGWSYRHSQIDGKFNRRAHSAKPSYVEKDSMEGGGEIQHGDAEYTARGAGQPRRHSPTCSAIAIAALWM